MTDQKPNCYKCPNFGKQSCPYIDDGETMWMDEDGNTLSDEQVTMTTEVVGCLTHPGARAYLMKDVVEELERLEREGKGEANYSKWRAYGKAITLIKNGVGKNP